MCACLSRPWVGWSISRLPRGARSLRLALGLALVVFLGAAQAQSLSLALGDLAGDGWHAEDVRLAIGDGAARVEARALGVLDRRFEAVRIDCGQFALEQGAWRCENGRLSTVPDLQFAFTWSPTSRRLTVSLATEREAWVFESEAGRLALRFGNAEIARLAPWVPGAIKPNAGRASGQVTWDGMRLAGDLQFTEAGFADASGLVAAEKLVARVALDAQREGIGWRWNGAMRWEGGALLVDPLFVPDGGWDLQAGGTLDDHALEITSASLAVREVGTLAFAGRLDRASRTLGRWQVSGSRLALAGLKPYLPGAWLESARLNDLSLAGEANVSAQGSGRAVERFALTVAGGGASSPARGLSIEGVALEFAHAPATRAPFRFAFGRATLHGLAFGPAEAQGESDGEGLSVPNLVIPVEDGVLALNDIRVARPEGHWLAEWQGAFTPLSMARIAQALGWPAMGGTISGVLPRMRYVEEAARSTFSVDGALLFQVFGGSARIEGIRVDNPFGRTPRLAADVTLTNLDLEDFTGAMKFGSITGRVDVRIKGLEMENWQPLAFEARIETSPGDFKKRISQRAVQNISSIGGAGAGAAIQASFLRFFETFGYRRIGLSCKLANDVCEMGGLGPSRDGGYLLVEGGGLPALNVVGYNRLVGWNMMLERIRAIIEGNSTMVVQ